MFRTRVIHLWLQMVGAAIGGLLAATVAVTVVDAELEPLTALALVFVLVLAALFIAIVGAFPMMALLQHLLLAVGARAGRPTDFGTFRRWLIRYSLVPALLPLLAFLLPSVRDNAGLASALLAVWTLTTPGVWYYNAQRLYLEWQAGVPH